MVNHRLHGELIKIYFFYKKCFNQIHEHIKDIIMNPHESVYCILGKMKFYVRWIVSCLFFNMARRRTIQSFIPLNKRAIIGRVKNNLG